MNRFLGASLATVCVLTCAAAYPDSPSTTQRFYEVPGAKLYTQTFGHGPPVVFLHGGMLFFDNNFAKQRDYFAAYRTVIGIDQRGRGHSPDGPWTLSYKVMADDVGEVLHHVDSPRRDRTRRPQKDLGTRSRHGWRSRFHVDRGNGRDIPGLAEWATHHCAGDWPRNSAETTGTCKSRDT